MNKKGLVFIYLLLVVGFSAVFTGCSTYYAFMEKTSTYYSETEKVILEKTLKSVYFNVGYDQDMELDFVYADRNEMIDLSGKDLILKKSLDGFEKEKIISFYSKMYNLKIITVTKMEKYKEGSDWKEYTYIKKYLLPPLQQYLFALEKAMVRLDKSYKIQIETLKKKTSK